MCLLIRDIGQLNPYHLRVSFFKAGYRPNFLNRRLLLEAFFLHTPNKRNTSKPLKDKPQINIWAFDTNYLLLNSEWRINPFVGIGVGRYDVVGQIYYGPLPDRACNSITGAGCSFTNNPKEKINSLIFNYGLYITILPPVTLRGDISLYNKLGRNNNLISISNHKLTSSIGISVRF